MTSGHPITDSTNVRLGVFDQAEVEVRIELPQPQPPNSNFKLDEWQFRLHTFPSSTGFFAITGRQYVCDPNNKGTNITHWHDSTTFFVKVIRCAIGSPHNIGFQVRAHFKTDPDPNNDFNIHRTGRIEQGWHQPDRGVNFTLDIAVATGTPPTGVAASYYDQDMIAMVRDSVREGAVKINSYLGRVILENDSNHNVTVKTYWDGAGQCGNAIGCFRIDGTYPHMRVEEMWFKFPPGNVTLFGNSTRWSNDRRDFRFPSTRRMFYYLPRVATHEFGHTLGSSHPVDHRGKLHAIYGPLMGSYAAGDLWDNTQGYRPQYGMVPVDGDIDALESTVEAHSH